MPSAFFVLKAFLCFPRPPEPAWNRPWYCSDWRKRGKEPFSIRLKIFFWATTKHAALGRWRLWLMMWLVLKSRFTCRNMLSNTQWLSRHLLNAQWDQPPASWSQLKKSCLKFPVDFLYLLSLATDTLDFYVQTKFLKFSQNKFWTLCLVDHISAVTLLLAIWYHLKACSFLFLMMSHLRGLCICWISRVWSGFGPEENVTNFSPTENWLCRLELLGELANLHLTGNTCRLYKVWRQCGEDCADCCTDGVAALGSIRVGGSITGNTRLVTTAGRLSDVT